MRVRSVVALVLAVVGGVMAPGVAQAATPADDPFYRYTGARPLAQVAPGTVLKTRVTPYHVLDRPIDLEAVQLLYRSTDARGRPSANVTTVVRPKGATATRLVAYGSAYDSLNPADSPSSVIAGGRLTLGGLLPTFESAVIGSLLLQGYAVSIADTQGSTTADFAAGPEYGMNTLDGLRAALASPRTGVARQSKVGMVGYSGGAIATSWAAQMAPRYAPDVDRRLVGAALGGLLVHPAHNLDYVEGSSIWAGVAGMALIGAARAYGVDVTPYLSPRGLKLFERLQDDSIIQVLGFYPGLKWTDIAKPEYPTPESVPEFVEIVNRLILGRDGSPTTPLYIAQGAAGNFEGTPNDKPGIGPGDGVMIAGDVRTLARQYCADGTKIQYREFTKLSHIPGAAAWYPPAVGWLSARFKGKPAPDNCADIAPGNPLDPVVYTPGG